MTLKLSPMKLSSMKILIFLILLLVSGVLSLAQVGIFLKFRLWK